MINYQTLCQQHQQFKCKQKSEQAVLLAEIEQLRQQLAENLGLSDKYYRKQITEEATEPYVTVGNIKLFSDQIHSPEIHFSLSVVLEEDEQSYPKYPQEQSLCCGFVQADRLYFTFFQERPEIKFSVNLQDDKQTKYRPIIEAYTQLLMKQLSR